MVIVHGWQNSPYVGLNPVIRNAYLSISDVNIIILDWRSVAHLNYVNSVMGVPEVGKALGQFLAFLSSDTSTPFSRIHLVGHSLGAHVVGNAGRQLNGRAARITGLDPAGPLWFMNPNRLTNTDAMYVEAIHTNGFALGTYMELGDADFYPNGGLIQPGCLTSSCSHSRSWKLFAASILNKKFVAHKCENKIEMLIDSCSGPELEMGNTNLNKTGRGVYRVDISDVYPY
ncbi:lipase member H-like [Galleria mellonella]|uniref:Lipase member H-like n=1 Tax=Galleria mellonella TaxID=7137 RepID=A0ABM3MM83_GALME|nr:lipase member H-like [Galleria mellonella]